MKHPHKKASIKDVMELEGVSRSTAQRKLSRIKKSYNSNIITYTQLLNHYSYLECRQQKWNNFTKNIRKQLKKHH